MATQDRSRSFIFSSIAPLFLFAVGLHAAARIALIHAWNFSTARSINNNHASRRINRLENTPDANAAAESTTNVSSQITNGERRSSLLSRRHLLSVIPQQTLAAVGLVVLAPPTSPAFARNMPVSNGADTSKVGTISMLMPLVTLRNNLELLRQTLEEEHRNKVDGRPLDIITKTKTALSFRNTSTGSNNGLTAIPIREEDFKRIFDAYSDQVSYKQNFLDQNAFLVYYTKGYDGPGRDSLEKDPVNERQTLQFGARNEVWICWDDFLAEWDFYVSSTRRADTITSDEVEEGFLDMIKYLSNTMQAVDSYLKLSPPEDLKAAQHQLSL
uniref:Uncharacterized protein n=1 Tax=Pseudo-nitzschia australis TaxID=44445 RepID=A0A6V0A6B0_9STRA|mmetsp:Transcript_13758/g.28862  ORF Transcript_13758/g.28862 Transcript_13758/m.28862 type:complete len:328 (+) Transcript_13758:48-1031(+)|eukprot:CAMPEP_0168252200 /NCGR_PEP_ID=MMETSP0141_2-20121125/3491_1 /TAXON_ID=44445 /ORGANISM="Pseudo-nitzschia australis, Strain 10249 10 AB" /LENGTH=327 /DNA_ID=CAMNT_0008188411 /DNA_START=23 /DNA_END=1006 /DNA_ORIENTATION=-